MHKGPSAVRRSGLAEQVVEHIQTLVAKGDYRVGERLPAEPELSVLFGVGRSTIREAMRVLSSRGLVEVRHGEGTFVTARAPRQSFEERIGKAALEEIYEARIFLELPLAELAAARRAKADVTAMRTALKRRSDAIERLDPDAYLESDFAFHVAVARATKNRALSEIYEAFVRVVKPQLATTIDAKYIESERDRLHAQLCDAIAAGDVGEARRLARIHLRTSQKGLSKLLD